MKSFATTIAINASAETVWALLTNAARYPVWNSTVEKIDGLIAPNEKLILHVKGAGRAFPLRVSTFDPPSQMIWTGGMPFGLFTGTRMFTLTPAPDGVTFAMREAFAGLLASLITRSIPDLQPVFDTFATDLRRAAEAAA